MNICRHSLTIILLPAALAALRADPSRPDASGPLGQTGQWVLKPAFSDEFNSATADPRKWTTKPASWGPWTWDENNATQENGILVLRMTYDPHTRGKDLGIMNIATAVPQAVAPLLGAFVVAMLVGFQGLFILSAVAALLGAAAVLPIRSVR